MQLNGGVFETVLAILSFLWVILAALPAPPRVVAVDDARAGELQPLPVHVGGRAVRSQNAPGRLIRQWPGTYFETSFIGRSAFFRLGPGEVTVHVKVDGNRIRTLMRPRPGPYRIDGVGNGHHDLRVEVASESQAGPSAFEGFFAPPAAKASAVKPRPRQIEFIGDSHTVGYGNTSRTRECTERDVWETTDTSQAFGPQLARRYGADYQVNAISGRGVVRNYDGFRGDTLPAAYPFALLNGRHPNRSAAWRPQLIVISLGTNDFSTPLKAGEKWHSLGDLRADYVASYIRFVKTLREQHPRAFFILWSTDSANGEVASQARQVTQRLRAQGEQRIAFVPIAGLDFGGCHYHPSLRDDGLIADRLAGVVEAQAPFGR